MIQLQDIEEPTNEVVDPENVELVIEKSMEWLTDNAGPFETVLLHWNVTRNERFTMLNSNRMCTDDYLSKFPAISTIEGYKLVCENNVFICGILLSIVFLKFQNISYIIFLI